MSERELSQFNLHQQATASQREPSISGSRRTDSTTRRTSRRPRMRPLWSALGLALAVTTIAACSTSSGPAGGGSSSTGSFSAGDGDLDTLLPSNTQLAFSEDGVLWAPIVSFNANGSIKYIQAKSIVGSKGDTVWTITFRSGWTFHNGEPVTAQSYANAWNFAAYGPNAQSNDFELAGIEGYAALNPKTGKPAVKTLSGLKVTGKETLQVTLSQADSQFPLELSQTAFYPLPNAGIKNPNSFKTDPIGDGPYEMAGAAQLNQFVKLKAFPKYQGANKAHIANLTFKLYSSADTEYTDVQAGSLDLALAPQDKFPELKTDFPGRVVYATGASIEYLAFPLFDKRFQNVKLREAISLALNRNAINKAIFGGVYEPADSLFAPAMTGGSTHSCQFCTFDPTKAKQLLKEAGGWSGPMVIAYPGGAGYDQAFQAVANQIRQNLGINASAQPSTNFSDFFSNMTAKKYTQGPFRGKWGSSYPSPSNTLESLFLPGATFNDSVGFYTNPAVTSLINAANAAPTLSASITDYQKAERTIMADFPVIPTFWERFPIVYSSRLKNVQVRPDEIDTDFEGIELK